MGAFDNLVDTASTYVRSLMFEHSAQLTSLRSQKDEVERRLERLELRLSAVAISSSKSETQHRTLQLQALAIEQTQILHATVARQEDLIRKQSGVLSENNVTNKPMALGACVIPTQGEQMRRAHRQARHTTRNI